MVVFNAIIFGNHKTASSLTASLQLLLQLPLDLSVLLLIIVYDLPGGFLIGRLGAFGQVHGVEFLLDDILAGG